MAMLGGDCSACCGGWWCYGQTCANMIASVRARVVSYPQIASDEVDSGSANSLQNSTLSESDARNKVAAIYNAARGVYRLRSLPAGGWKSLAPSVTTSCEQCEYSLVVAEHGSALPISSEWKVIINVCDQTSCVSVVGYQIATRLSVEYAAPSIAASDNRILSSQNTPGFGLPPFSARLDDTAFDSGGSCSYSNNGNIFVHQNAGGGSASVAFVDYAIAGEYFGQPAMRLVQEYRPASTMAFTHAGASNGGTQNNAQQSTYRTWLPAVDGVRCTSLSQLSQNTTIEIEVTTQ
jgi:hypothetical protein